MGLNHDSGLEGAIHDVAIIGTGFGGIGMAYYLRRAGIDSLVMFEKAGDVGGVWRDNTYPGAACDVASHLYSFAFEPHYPWSRRYGPQPEIHAYLRHVADRHDLRRHVRFHSEVVEARFDARRGLWRIGLADGQTCEARILISAVGQLNRPKIPDLPGLERFAGHSFHSARWDDTYELRNKTVAVIGTGPSAVQFVPAIAPHVAHLQVYQRSSAWTLPKFDSAYAGWERWLLRRLPLLHTLDRWRIFWWYEFLASALQNDALLRGPSRALLRTAARMLMRHQVRDPELQATLQPDSPLGCKRILLSNEWLPALARDNVEVITTPLAEATPGGLRCADGRERAADCLIFGTGFSATEFLAPMDFHGLDGQSLRQRWRDGAQGYLGVAVSGFPNLFMLYGPNSNLGAGSIIYMLERQQRYVTRLVTELRRRRLAWIDVRAQAQDAFNEEMTRRSGQLAYTDGCSNWYLTNGRNTNNWVSYMSAYGWRMRHPQLTHFNLQSADAASVT